MWRCKTIKLLHIRFPPLFLPLCTVSIRIQSIRIRSFLSYISNFYGLYNSIDLKKIALLIETGSHTKEVRRIARAVRLTMGLRRKLTASVLYAFLDFALSPGSDPHTRLSAYLPKVHLLTFSSFWTVVVFSKLACNLRIKIANHEWLILCTRAGNRLGKSVILHISYVFNIGCR